MKNRTLVTLRINFHPVFIMAINPKYKFSGMRELTSFDTAHSAFGEFIIMRPSFTDTIIGFRKIEPEPYPDQPD